MGKVSEQVFLKRNTNGQQRNLTMHQRNAYPNYNEISPYSSQNGYKRQKIINADKDVETSETLYTIGLNVN